MGLPSAANTIPTVMIAPITNQTSIAAKKFISPDHTRTTGRFKQSSRFPRYELPIRYVADSSH